LPQPHTHKSRPQLFAACRNAWKCRARDVPQHQPPPPYTAAFSFFFAIRPIVLYRSVEKCRRCVLQWKKVKCSRWQRRERVAAWRSLTFECKSRGCVLQLPSSALSNNSGADRSGSGCACRRSRFVSACMCVNVSVCLCEEQNSAEWSDTHQIFNF
jgi:hypothetical protein